MERFRLRVTFLLVKSIGRNWLNIYQGKEKMFQFVRRHKNKLGFVGIGIAALSGGLYVAQQYIAKNALEAQISETRNLINQSRHHKQFQSILRYEIVH